MITDLMKLQNRKDLPDNIDREIILIDIVVTDTDEEKGVLILEYYRKFSLYSENGMRYESHASLIISKDQSLWYTTPVSKYPINLDNYIKYNYIIESFSKNIGNCIVTFGKMKIKNGHFPGIESYFMKHNARQIITNPFISPFGHNDTRKEHTLEAKDRILNNFIVNIFESNDACKEEVIALISRYLFTIEDIRNK